MLINRSSLWVSVALVAPCFAASGSFPLVMVANHGQAGASARFLAKGPRMSVHFEPAAAVVRLGGAELRIEYPGATGPDQILPEAAASGVANFLIGPADTWVLDEPLLSGIRYSNLYGHIDLSYRASGANLKSEFLVPPGEDPGRIRLRYRGATQITVAPDGALMIQVGRHTLRESPPVLYQEHGGSRSAVAGGYRVDGDMVSFSVAPYDTMAPLVVDPVLSYVTLIGGAGADAATAMAIDSSGAAYLAGFTASYDLPVTTPEQSANAGGNEAFVAKLNATGNALVFCTYIGGRGDDRAYGIAVDSSGSAYVAGSTTSTNFPVKSALQSKLAGGRNAFVLKLTPAGNALVFSTYLGGSGLDSATAIALDSARNAYIGGDTTSLNFPAGAMQTVNRGASDGFVAKLPADGSRLIFATYLGGSGDDHISTIGVDSAGSAVVVGSTYSPDFPIANARQPQLGGGQDAFIAKLAADGKSLVFSTYFGGSGGMMGAPEAAYGVAVDGAGNIYVAGETGSTNFPVRTPAQSSNAGWQDAFAAKWTPTGSLVYSTYIGGVNLDSARAVAVDSAGAAYVVGETTSANMAALAGTAGAATGIYDAFLVKLTPAGDAAAALVYLGGVGADTATAVAVDSAANVYIAGWTQSPNFPTVGGVQTVNGGNYGAFVAKMNLSVQVSVAVTPGTASLHGNETQQFSATVANTSNPAVTWSLSPAGTGSISTAGLYTAPASIAASKTVTIIATSVADPLRSGSATVTLEPAASNGAALRFVPISSCRIADTRSSAGPFGGPALTGGVSRDFALPAGSCGIPRTAAAYSLNLTVIPSGALGFLSIWAAGQPQPGVSTLNSDGRIKANAAIVPAGLNGGITVFASNTTHLAIDINGYFVPANDSTALAYYPVNPCRIIDTRYASGPFGGPALAPSVVRTIPVLGGPCNIPTGAQAYVLNISVVPPGPLGFLSAWTADTAWPGSSTLNAPTGAVTANMAIVRSGTTGAVALMASHATDVIIDITGYFAPPAPGAADFYVVSPCRVADTRGSAGAFGGPILGAGEARRFPFATSACGIPAGAKAYSLGATVVPPGALGYLTLWSDGSMPVVSTLNSPDAAVVSNAAFVPADSTGGIRAFASSPTHLILDVNGYFQ